MSYSERDGQVVLTMSREDYEMLQHAVGLARGWAVNPEPIRKMFQRLGEGNPNYTPYQTGEKK